MDETIACDVEILARSTKPVGLRQCSSVVPQWSILVLTPTPRSEYPEASVYGKQLTWGDIPFRALTCSGIFMINIFL